MNPIQTGFICGLPRSGTTWLARTLATHPLVAVFGETDFWGRDYVSPKHDGEYDLRQIQQIAKIQSGKEWQTTTGDDRNLPGLKIGDYQRIANDLVTCSLSLDCKETPTTVFYKLASGVAQVQDKTFVIEKTPGHLLFLDRIRTAYPLSPTIILFREPYGFIASLTHHAARPSQKIPLWLKRFAYHPALTVYWWKVYARSLIAQQREQNNKTLLIDHHQLITDPGSAVRSAATHMGIDPNLLTVDQTPVNSSFAKMPRRSAPNTTGYWLRLLAHKELSCLYPNHRSPQLNKLAILASWVVLFPSLFLFTAVFLPRSTRVTKYLSSVFSSGKDASN